GTRAMRVVGPPEHDRLSHHRLFSELRGDGAAGRDEHYTERLVRSPRTASTAAGTSVFSGRLTSPRFNASLHLTDVYLDSIGWSGGNTTLEGLQHNLPNVTIAGPPDAQPAYVGDAVPDGD